MDVVFEIEMSTFKEIKHEGPAFPCGVAASMLIPTKNPNLFYHKNRSITPYMDMISSN